MMKMRTSWLSVVGALLLVLTGTAMQSEAGVRVGINLPVVRFDAPPEVVVIPGTYVYMVPGIDMDIMFYQGYWWRPYEGQWYRSRDYKGKWRHIQPRHIPRGLRALPQDYRHRITPGHERIQHRDVQRNWNRWEKQKHWDKRDERDHGRHDNKDSGRHGNQDRDNRDDKKDRY